MIIRSLTPETSLYRALVPAWAHAPLSGKGAAVRGGRFNRPGADAIYLSLSAVTALAEYQQTSPFLPPATIASYRARAQVVDLTQFREGDPAWHPLWASWDVDWRTCLFDQHG